ncbi:MAG: hypothetical protein JWP44_4559 [Mucilaginibacter sp.]|nr:hypothetical protein [Mucilaginibacter sp.]
MTKKYTLKPGMHQFAPGSYAAHSNDNLTDEDVEWYLEKYPHIKALFIERLGNCKVEKLEDTTDQTTESSKQQ